MCSTQQMSLLSCSFWSLLCYFWIVLHINWHTLIGYTCNLDYRSLIIIFIVRKLFETKHTREYFIPLDRLSTYTSSWCAHLCLTVLILILSIILVEHRHTLGSGDIPVLLSLVLSNTPVIFSCTLLISCCLALLYLLYSQQKRLPFVPFLSGGWVITNLYILFLL